MASTEYTDASMVYKYLIAYGLAILIFIGITKTKIGYNLVYYILVLALLFVAVTQYKFIVDALSPITNYNVADAMIAQGTAGAAASTNG